MGTLTIRIDDKLEEELTRLARKTQRTKSDLAREVLRRHIARARFEEARHLIAPYAEAAGYLTDEEVFRDVS
ncbi:MAG: ribbon-helix-helix protein, CopG family [Pseudomonadota bacterium]|nr:ribbon-helix-helix protein, CopG family [Pseudomonadota bacterium]